MNVSEVLKNAWSAVEEAGLPAEVQPLAFREAVRLMAPAIQSDSPRRRTAVNTPPGGGASGTPFTPSVEDGIASEEEIYERIVTHTGVDRHHLEQVIHLDDDGIRISLPGLKLGSNTAERIRSVAQILTIARGFGQEETETPLDAIRGECNRLKVYDPANFGTHVSKLNGFVLTGSGQNRRLRAKSAGIEGFPALVERLLGTS